MVQNCKLPTFLPRFISAMVLFAALLVFSNSGLLAQGVKANVHVIIDKLPIDKQEKMKNFHRVVKDYIENVPWFEQDDYVPIEVTLQLFLTDSPSSIEDRYNCELLVSSSDVQYFDKRFRFAYQTGEKLQYSEQAVEPHTGVLNFYMNMILGNELDKNSGFGGDIYYKRAQSVVELGKFVRTDFIRGWLEREQLIKRVFVEPFMTFRKMKDHYFYGIFIREKNLTEARKHLQIALDMLETVIEKKSDLEEPRQFLNAHYLELIDIFKDYENKKDVFKKLIKLDADHKKQYEEHIGDS